MHILDISILAYYVSTGIASGPWSSGAHDGVPRSQGRKTREAVLLEVVTGPCKARRLKSSGHLFYTSHCWGFVHLI